MEGTSMNKKTITSVILACLMITGIGSAQDNTDKKEEEQKKFKISDDFLNTWTKVGDMTKDIQSFKTEQAVTVAGVRGAEAEDAALKHLYFKGGVRYPNRLELLNALEILEEFIEENPDDPSIAQSIFYVGQIYVQIGDPEKGREMFSEILENHSESDYAELAKAEIDLIEDQN